MSLNFGDISGVELREKPQDESDLEDEVFFKNGKEDLDKTNDNNKTVPVACRYLARFTRIFLL